MIDPCANLKHPCSGDVRFSGCFPVQYLKGGCLSPGGSWIENVLIALMPTPLYYEKQPIFTYPSASKHWLEAPTAIKMNDL